jgi:hypothetical protein
MYIIYFLGFVGLTLFSLLVIQTANCISVGCVILIPVWSLMLIVGIPCLVDDIKYKKGL